jgi:hypothetical protein
MGCVREGAGTGTELTGWECMMKRTREMIQISALWVGGLDAKLPRHAKVCGTLMPRETSGYGCIGLT